MSETIRGPASAAAGPTGWQRRHLLALASLASLAPLRSPARAATPAPPHWSAGQALFSGDNPTAVAADRQRLYLLVAPHLRGVRDGTSGLVAIDRGTLEARMLMKSADGLLPNHMGGVLDGGDRLFWLNGLRIMQTDKRSGETRLFGQEGSLAMAIGGAALYSCGHDNRHALLRFDLAGGAPQELARLPLPVVALQADEAGVFALLRPASQDSRRGLLHVDARDGRVQEVAAPSRPRSQIRAMVGHAAASGARRITGVTLLERDLDANQLILRHVAWPGGAARVLPIAERILELRPLAGTAEALFCFADRRGPDGPWRLLRIALQAGAGPAALELSRGTRPPTSLLVEGGQVFWSDVASVLRLALPA